MDMIGHPLTLSKFSCYPNQVGPFWLARKVAAIVGEAAHAITIQSVRTNGLISPNGTILGRANENHAKRGEPEREVYREG
jgi:hypothetical protein